MGRSPHGERGLKFRGDGIALEALAVAPPAGSVDDIARIDTAERYKADLKLYCKRKK